VGARDAIARLLTGIKAYHSSPHDFERFDLSKIGTGEGAQAYGHGLYFAENPKVSGIGGQYYQNFESRFLKDNAEGRALDYLKHSGYDHQQAIKWLDETLAERQARGLTGAPDHQKLVDARELLATGGKVGPRTYEVNIKADPAQMLDWDKPLAQQGETVQGLASRFGIRPDDFGFTKGAAFYRKVGDFLGPTGKTANFNASASEGLAGQGIPGIKYLDEGSRTLAARANNPRNANWAADDAAFRATPPTSNYVVFDPANIDILKKYGIAGAAAAPVVGAAMGSTYDQGTYQEPDPMQGTYQ
jgi:hypothetical protein